MDVPACPVLTEGPRDRVYVAEPLRLRCLMPGKSRTLIFLIALTLGACASEPAPEPVVAAGDPDDVLRQLVNTENGLEVRKWLVVDDPQIVGAALLTHADRFALDEEQDQRLRRNGFRFLRVPIESLDALLGALGGTTLDLSAWHGQIYDWRQIDSVPIGQAGEALVVDGRIRRFSRRRLVLLVRGWTMPMEDGPRMCLQLRVAVDRPTGGVLQQLLERTPTENTLPSLDVETGLEAGFAYVLTCESPAASWEGAGAKEGDGSQGAAAAAGRIGPGDFVGPDVEAPKTVGRRLLTPPLEQGRRAMLVFVPRIPPAMYPSMQGSDTAIMETGGRP